LRGLEIIGPVYGPTGYDRHTREFTRQLAALGTPVQLTPLSGWSPELPSLMKDSFFEGLLRPIETDVALNFAMPHHCLPRKGKHRVNYTMFEGNHIPAEWVRLAAHQDLIVVPTKACADAWTDSGVAADRVRISPLAADGAFFSQPAEATTMTVPLANSPMGRPLSTYTYRFLNIAELRPRKNLLGILRTWIRTTKRTDDAVLLIKSMSFEDDNRRAFVEDLQRMQLQLGRTLQDAAPVIAIGGVMNDEQLRSLYCSATHYLSMSFGEGWDLAMMEAACAGLQLIAPDHTGYRSYLTAEEATLIPVKLVPAVFEGRAGNIDQLFFKGIQWWQPDEDAAVEALRTILGGGGIKKSPQERIVHKFTWENAGRSLHTILQELR